MHGVWYAFCYGPVETMNTSATLTRLAAFGCAVSTVFLAGCTDNRSYSPSSPTPFPVTNGGTLAAGGHSAKPLDEYGDDTPIPAPEPPPPAPSLIITITSRNGAQSFLPNPADAAGQFVVFRNADSIVQIGRASCRERV